MKRIYSNISFLIGSGITQDGILPLAEELSWTIKTLFSNCALPTNLKYQWNEWKEYQVTVNI